MEGITVFTLASCTEGFRSIAVGKDEGRLGCGTNCSDVSNRKLFKRRQSPDSERFNPSKKKKLSRV